MQNNITKKDFQELTKTVKEGFQQQDKKTDRKIEGLAKMIKKGFDDRQGQLPLLPPFNDRN